MIRFFKDEIFRQLSRVSFSLMISFLSMVVMMFIDRLFLAQYSQSALSASSSAGTLCWAINFGWVTLVGMVTVFVAQYNGAKKFEKIGESVWQMVWLSIASMVFFFPLATYGSSYMFSSGLINSHEALYLRWNIYYAPFLVLLSALSAFYIGQEKTSIIKWLALLGNSINIALDPLLIFGVDGMIKPMGIKGAAIATGIGIIIQVVILFIFILQKENREKFGSNRWRLKLEPLKKCLKIGIPPAIFVTCELFGWALFYWMMAKVSQNHIMVASICQSIMILFFFFGMGLEKGAAAVCGNLIGARKIDEIKKVFLSGLCLIALFSFVTCFFFMIYPDFLIDWFLVKGAKLGQPFFSHVEIKPLIKTGLILSGIYLTFENIRWLQSGILTSAGDMMFLLISRIACIWLFMILPIYFFVVRASGGIEVAYLIWIFYSLVANLIIFIRLALGKWKNKDLLDETEAAFEENPEQIS